MNVWLLQACTEEGDEYGPWVFARKPSERAVERVLELEAPGISLCWNLEKLEVL